MNVENEVITKKINDIVTFYIDEELTTYEILGVFCIKTFEELIYTLKKYFEESIENFYIHEEMAKNYKEFIYILCNKYSFSKQDNLYLLKYLLNKNIKALKKYLKDYNKGLKCKDSKYYLLYQYLVSLSSISETTIHFNIKTQEVNENFKIMWFIITTLRNENYLYRILEKHPDFVNARGFDNKPLLYLIINNLYDNVKEFDEETIKYYKRVIIMFLESNNLILKNNELDEIFNLAKIYKKKKSEEVIKIVEFIVEELNLYYPVINKDSRRRAVDYCLECCPIELITNSKGVRKDLRKHFTLSIDSFNNETSKMLFDDAFIFNRLKNGLYELIINVPDVDYFVEKDSETDKFMRGISESVYVKDYKTSMLNYELANKCSLNSGNDRLALSIILKIDDGGYILDINFAKSIINVNYNLSRRKASLFMHNNSDSRLYMLNELYMLAKILRKRRGETVGKREASAVIMDEINIIADLATATYFKNNGIIFPYKNYLGKSIIDSKNYSSLCREFSKENDLSENSKNILFSIFDARNRIYYDTVSVGNKAFNGLDIGNVGNPLREYISLESDRLIKELLIENKQNYDYWQERIERDCIEYTEKAAKIKRLYQKK